MTADDIPADALKAALRTLRRSIAQFGAVYPDDTTVGGVYRPRAARNGFPEGANVGWTTGFWPGMHWLAYETTGEELFRRSGERHVESFAARLEGDVDLETHDLGFLYTLSCVAPARLLGDRRAAQVALGAADRLLTRYLEPAGIVQAWGDLRDPAQRGRTIIDSLMNLPLLHWASRQSGDDRYAAAAYRHARELRDHILRPDDSTFHTFYWDAETGEPLRGATEQGHQDDSCWARGQAWGLYGFALSFRCTGDRTLLDASVRCADYLLAHLPGDRVPYWDLAFSDGSGEERDSSAAAIAVCGLLELAAALGPGPAADRYRSESAAMLASLATGYTPSAGSAPPAGSPTNALLLHGVYDKPKSVGVDEANLWGDYFYLEGLVRSGTPGWQPYW